MTEINYQSFKIIVIGENGIGKTSFIENSFKHLQIKDSIYSSKHSLQSCKQNGEFKIKFYEFEKKKIKLQLWRYDSNPATITNSKIFRGAHLVIVMHDLCKLEFSSNNLKGWIQECKRYCNSPIIAIGTKLDLVNHSSRSLNEFDIQNNIKSIMRSLSNSNLNESEMDVPYFEISNNNYSNQIQELLFKSIYTKSFDYYNILSPQQLQQSQLNNNSNNNNSLVVYKNTNKKKNNNILSLILFWRR